MAKDDAAKLDKILQQLKRQFLSSSGRPPDAAAAALGRELAAEFIFCTSPATSSATTALLASSSSAGPASSGPTTMNEDGSAVLVRERVLLVLVNPELHPSIPHVFFEVFSDWMSETTNATQQQPRTTNCTWLAQWLLQIEEAFCKQQQSARRKHSIMGESLSAVIRTYALYLAYGDDRVDHNNNNNNEASSRDTATAAAVLNTYTSLRLASSRMMLIRELVPTVLEHDPYRAKLVLSPLLARTVLARSSPASERRAFLHHWYRSMGMGWTVYSPQQCYDLLQWMTDSLNLFLLTLPDDDPEERIGSVDVAESWLTETMTLAKYLMESPSPSSSPKLGVPIDLWLNRLICDTLPRLLTSSSHRRFVWRPVLESVLDCLEEQHTIVQQVDTATILRLASLTVATPLPNDRHGLLTLLSLLRPTSWSGGAILHEVGSIYSHEEPYQEAAMVLHQSLRQDGSVSTNKRKAAHVELTQFPNLLDAPPTSAGGGLVELVLSIRDFAAVHWSGLQQVSALLLGAALLDDKKRSESAHTYLGRLVHRYPHLGILLLPVFLERVHEKSSRGNGPALVKSLEFVCQYLVGDLYCAQQVWNLVGVQWMQTHTHLSVRVLLLRLFPKLCTGNKRLYGRVVDVLVTSSRDKVPEVRLAVAATLADLAREDSLLDVSEVIGAIQNLLVEDRTTPIHSLIVRYAVLCLHHLTMNQELEFDLVIKVLKKKLCPITDKNLVLALPVVVLEALVLLLGDGQVTDNDDDPDGALEPNRASLVTISPQVSSSIQALIDIGDDLRNRSESDYDPGSKVAHIKARENVLLSLNRYSLEALGLDAAGVKAVFETSDDLDERPPLPASAVRYNALRDLVSGELVNLFEKACSSDDSHTDAVSNLLGRMLAFEQDALGGSLWVKRGVVSKKSRDTREAKKKLSARSALPSRTLINEFHDQNRSPPSAVAVAMLLSSDGTQISVLRDNADASIDSADPLMIVFALRGFLHTTERLLDTNSSSIMDVLLEVRGWHEIFLSSDAWYLALSALSIHLPRGPDSASTAQGAAEIAQQVISAFTGHAFQKERVSKLCLGLVGISCLRDANLDLLNKIIDILEESVRGYGGQKDFGAYFGLALIARETAESLDKQKSGIPASSKVQLIAKISAFLVEELLSCYTDGGEELQQLVLSLKNGSGSDGLVQSMESLDSNSMALLMTKYVTARDLFISCAVCLPALQVVQGDLLLAVFRLLESFEWGGGKGLAIPSVLDACRRANLISHDELVQIHAEYSGIFEHRLVGDDADIDADGLEDIFYAVNGVSKQASARIVSRLLVGNRELFDDDGRAVSLIAATASVACLPLFGAAPFTEAAKLYGTATRKDIRGIVEIVNDVAKLNDNTMYCSTAIMLTGLLSSIKDVISIDSTEPGESHEDEISSETHQAAEDDPDGIDFDQLPMPQTGTFLESTINAIKKFCRRHDEQDRACVVLTRAMSALANLSVPSSYAHGLVEKLLMKENVPKSPVINFLASQIVGRRSALFDGRDYISLTVKISTAAHDEWSAFWQEKQAVLLFVQRFPDIAPKLPTESLEEVIGSIWFKCRATKTESLDNMLAFISGFRLVLQSTAFSPKALSVVRNFAYGKLCTDLQGAELGNLLAGKPSLLEYYVSCLKEVPLSLLDQAKFFVLHGTHEDFQRDIFRILLLLALLKTDFFESPNRKDQDLRRLLSWLLKNLSHSTGEKEWGSLRLVFCSFASAARRMSTEDQRDKVTSLFEVLLMSTREGIKTGLELLAVLLATWSSGASADGGLSWSHLAMLDGESAQALPGKDLERLYQVFLTDLPVNLYAFATDNGLATVVANQLHRLYAHLCDRGIEERIRSIIEQALILCQSRKDKEEIFVSLSSAVLQFGRAT